MFTAPADLFSFTPFTPYPVGSVLLTCVALVLAGMDFQLTTFTFSALVLPWMIYFSYRLNRRIVSDATVAALGAFAYANFPILLQYCYLTMTARLPVLGIIPLFLEYLLVYAQTGERRPLAYATALALFANLFHRMAMVLILLVPVAVATPYVLTWGRRLICWLHITVVSRLSLIHI